jgi:hypothetical protein
VQMYLGLFPRHRVATGSGSHPVTCPVGTGEGGVSPKLKRPGYEADYIPACSAEIRNDWSYTSTLPYIFMEWFLVKHRYNFTLGFRLNVILLYPSIFIPAGVQQIFATKFYTNLPQYHLHIWPTLIFLISLK